MPSQISSVIFVFHLIKASYKAQTAMAPSRKVAIGQLKRHSNFIILGLTLNFIIKVVSRLYDVSVYEKQKIKTFTKDAKHLKEDKWRNDCPIILVHGYAGSTMDESMLFKGYFSYCFDENVARNLELYEADVSSSGSIHDRACELYQQIVGVSYVEAWAEQNNYEVSEQVYGPGHQNSKHFDKYYKRKFLKAIRGGKMLAYPSGLPGGWSKHRKVHLVGHSQGAPTIRYLQHLLETGYFKDDFYGQDRSDWIASVSCVNGCLNGGLGTHFFRFDQDQQAFSNTKTIRERLFVEGFKLCSVAQNLLSKGMTSNSQPEIIKRTIKIKQLEEQVWELDSQMGILFDFNPEIYGFNRQPDEPIIEYMKRVYYMDNLYNNREVCFGISELVPGNLKRMNAFLKTYDNTYYFTVTGSMKNNNRVCQQEIMKEPRQLTDLILGFDIDVRQNVELTNNSNKPDHRKEAISLTQRALATIKTMTNLISVGTSLFFPNFYEFKPPMKNLNNLFHDQNDIFAIDYANKDWTHDHDNLLPRKTQEYPKISKAYKNKRGAIKPWGEKSDPIYYNCKQDAVIQNPDYQKGVWYFSSLQQVDHLDLCGMNNILQAPRLFFGMEFRPQFWINLFNRLKLLEVEGSKTFFE